MKILIFLFLLCLAYAKNESIELAKNIKTKIMENIPNLDHYEINKEAINDNVGKFDIKKIIYYDPEAEEREQNKQFFTYLAISVGMVIIITLLIILVMLIIKRKYKGNITISRDFEKANEDSVDSKRGEKRQVIEIVEK